MRHAVAEVQRVLPGARLAEAGPDYVGVSEIAGYLGISRQATRKWVVSRGANFPLAIHEVNGSIWHLAEVLEWMRVVAGFSVPEELLQVSRSAVGLNLRVEVRRRRQLLRQNANPEIIVPSTSSE